MLLSPDPDKRTQEVFFLRKNQVQTHPSKILNSIQVKRMLHRKYFGILLDEKLNFKQHADKVILKISKGISLIKKLRHFALVTIRKAFLRLLIDDGCIMYDQFQNEF